jgi:DNA-binding NarL/FixJ family response regulator
MADDHTIVRQGLRRMLEENERIEIVGEAQNGREAVALCEQLQPDVLLLDVSMPEKDGFEAAAEIAALGLHTRVLMISVHDPETYAPRAIEAGAAGYVNKDVGREGLVHAISEVAAGRTYVPDVDLAGDEGRGDPAHLLSTREREVMKYLARGMTNREIADLLGISIKTVDTHRGHVLKKLGLRNNSDLTRFAIRYGYVDS